MSWITNNIFYISFVVTLTGAVSAFITVDKLKKFISSLVVLVGALFTLFNSISIHNSSTINSRKVDSTEKVNDSLQRKLNNKADTIQAKQKQQYEEFKTSSNRFLTKIATITDSLKIVLLNQKETNTSIIGSLAHPFFQIILSPTYLENKYEVEFWLNNKDKYPLRKLDIDFPITYDHITKITYQEENSPAINYESNTAGPNSKHSSVLDLQPFNPELILTDHFPQGLNCLNYPIKFRFKRENYTIVVQFKRDGQYYELNKLEVFKAFPIKHLNPNEYVIILNTLSKNFGKDANKHIK